MYIKENAVDVFDQSGSMDTRIKDRNADGWLLLGPATVARNPYGSLYVLTWIREREAR